MIRIGAVIATIVLAVGLASCATSTEQPTPTTLTSQSPAPPASSAPTPTPSVTVDDTTGETLAPPDPATWDDTSRAEVQQAAVTAMTAFARPDLTFEDWWADLSPQLTQQAQMDHLYTDPANVPARVVLGSLGIVDDTSAYVAKVEVVTDIGVYTVTMTRQGQRSPWLASRFAPPEELG